MEAGRASSPGKTKEQLKKNGEKIDVGESLTPIESSEVLEAVIEEQLSHRVVKGGFWVFALRITDRVFYIIKLIILARILAPHDFGLLGIAMLTMMTLETFSQTGFQAALIQKKENIEAYLNSAWTVGIIRGFILFIIFFDDSKNPFIRFFYQLSFLSFYSSHIINFIII